MAQEETSPLTDDIRYVADRMQNSIEAASIVDSLFQPHKFSILIACDDVSFVSLLLVARTGR